MLGRTLATILHADLDAFYASVEQRDAPELRGRPVLVGGGVVLAASYEAKAFGVKTAMGGRRALALCPDAVVVPPRFSAYVEASRAVFAVFEQLTPLVEPLSIDEAFLDVRGLERISGSPRELAVRLRYEVREEVGLAITVGIATTKFLAKVASAAAKPDGLLEVPPGEELAFLHPLPVERLWGVGAKTAPKLHAAGVRTVGDVAALGEAGLVDLLGRGAGRHLHALAHARDPRRVVTGKRRRSIGAQRAMGRGPHRWAEVETSLVGLVDRVARRLRKAGRRARTLVLRLRFDDYTRATRSHTLGAPTDRTPALLAAARDLLAAARPLVAARGITLVGIALTNLEDAPAQLSLEGEDAQAASLDATLDSVRARFGSASIGRAVHLGKDPGLQVPLLPD